MPDNLSMKSTIEEALRKLLSSNFPDVILPANATRRIAKGCLLRRLARGSTLFAQGSATPALYGVVTGVVEARFIGTDGSASVVERMTEGRLFGLASFASGRPSTYEALACRASRVLAIEPVAYDGLLAEIPGFARALLKELAGRHHGALQLLELARHQSAATRLASALAQSMGSAGSTESNSGWRFVRVTQADLASLGGLSRQTVNEILSKWAASGRVRTDYGGIWVREPAHAS